MTKTVYTTTIIDMEPYSNHCSCGPVFSTLKSADKFLSENSGVFDEGYFYWDEDQQDIVPCDKAHEDAHYEHGWAYLSYTQEVKYYD